MAHVRRFVGEKAIYRKTNSLGRGGNGSVFEVTVTKSYVNEVVTGSRLALKLFAIPEKLKDYKKRRKRFIKEIKTVLKLQEQIDGIMPIVDKSNLSENGGSIWYVMPLAEPYGISEAGLINEILADFERIAETVRKIHHSRFYHRDIKPENLLIMKGKVYLSDFGLVGSVGGDEPRITDAKDRVGPWRILPPELREIDETRIDYRKSDVYLLAKTLWIVLQNNNNGFPGVYNRRKQLRLDREKYSVVTFEPLHQLLEESTKDEYEDRPDIDGFLWYLWQQKDVINNRLPEEVINQLIHKEMVAESCCQIEEDEIVYSTPAKIDYVLQGLLQFCSLVDPVQNIALGIISKIDRTSANTYCFSFKKVKGEAPWKKMYVCIARLRVLNDSQNTVIIETKRQELPVPENGRVLDLGDVLRLQQQEVYLDSAMVLHAYVEQ